MTEEAVAENADHFSGDGDEVGGQSGQGEDEVGGQSGQGGDEVGGQSGQGTYK
jgi:hypothetical protein